MLHTFQLVAGDKVIRVAIPEKSIYLPGHKFKTGDQLSLVSVGGTIKASATSSLNNIFDLANVDLFAVRVGTNLLGIATSKAFAGISSSVFFVGSGLEGKIILFHRLKIILLVSSRKFLLKLSLIPITA